VKNNKTTRSAALFAMIGVFQVSTAHADGQSFTPIENLPPEQRQQITEEVANITKNIIIDWDEIAVGLDENEKIIFIPKSEAGLKHLANPSCFGSIMNEK